MSPAMPTSEDGPQRSPASRETRSFAAASRARSSRGEHGLIRPRRRAGVRRREVLSPYRRCRGRSGRSREVARRRDHRLVESRGPPARWEHPHPPGNEDRDERDRDHADQRRAPHRVPRRRRGPAEQRGQSEGNEEEQRTLDDRSNEHGFHGYLPSFRASSIRTASRSSSSCARPVSDIRRSATAAAGRAAKNVLRCAGVPSCGRDALPGMIDDFALPTWAQPSFILQDPWGPDRRIAGRSAPPPGLPTVALP